MDYTRARTAADMLNILKAYRDELHELELRKPRWPVLERLINRETEMTPVWNEIAGHELTPVQCRTLLEQLFFAGAYGSEEEFRVIYQPVYSPWVNHVERLWKALHDTISRNHQCRSMWQLLKFATLWKLPAHSLEANTGLKKCSGIRRTYLVV